MVQKLLMNDDGNDNEFNNNQVKQSAPWTTRKWIRLISYGS